MSTFEFSVAHPEGTSVLTLDGKAYWRPAVAPNVKAGITQGRLKSCSYCGSIHPAVLAEAIRAGAKGEWADFKYGWPHKAYFDGLPNPHAGMPCAIEGSSKPPTDEQLAKGEVWTAPSGASFSKLWWKMTTSAATTWAKFYTVHLLDATAEDRDTIERHLGLSFDFQGEGAQRQVSWKRYGATE